MSDCEKYREDISAYIDNELAPSEAEDLESHMENCGDCRTLYGELTSIQQALAQTEREAPSKLTPGILYKTTVDVRPNPWTRRISALVSVAACLVVLLWIGQSADFGLVPDNRENAPAQERLSETDNVPPVVNDNSSEDLSNAPAEADDALKNDGDGALPNDAYGGEPEPNAEIHAPPSVDSTPQAFTLTVQTEKGGHIPPDALRDALFPAGSEILLVAEAEPGYAFDGWVCAEGGRFQDPENPQTLFYMPNGDATVTARFRLYP